MGTSPGTGLVTQPTQPEFFNQLQRSGYNSTSSSLICADKLAAAQHMCSRVPLSSSVLEPMPLRDGILSIVWALYGRCYWARSFTFSLLVYDVTDAGPASHRVRLWQGGPASTYCRFRLLVLQFTGTSIPGVRLLALPEFRKRPWPLRRPRGDGNGGRFVRSPCLPSWCGLRLLYAVHQMLFLWSLYRCGHGAAGHNRWGVVATPLPVKTQGGTMNFFLNFVHRVLLWGGFQVSLRKVQQGLAVAMVVTCPSSWKGALC